MSTAKIGLGIATYNRPDFFEVCIKSVVKYIYDKLDVIYVYNDGSSADYSRIVEYLKDYPKVTYIDNVENYGVARAKNVLLKKLMDFGCTHLFLMEDDMRVVSDQLIAVYIAAARMSNVPHLNFSQHGPNKEVATVATNGPLAYWPNAVGAFSYYTRQTIEDAGYIDENFKNAYDHVEHTWRIYNGKFPYGVYPDVIGSERFIQEQEEALLKSTTRGVDWLEKVNEAREYWQKKDKDCPLQGGTI